MNPNYAHAYNNLAWVRATSPDAVFRNGERVVELAERAVEVDQDVYNLDTLAVAYAEMGSFEEAISTQLQAIALPKKEGDKTYMAEFEEHLQRYRTHKPWRMSVPGNLSNHTKLNALPNIIQVARGRAALQTLPRNPRKAASAGRSEKTGYLHREKWGLLP